MTRKMATHLSQYMVRNMCMYTHTRARVLCVCRWRFHLRWFRHKISVWRASYLLIKELLNSRVIMSPNECKILFKTSTKLGILKAKTQKTPHRGRGDTPLPHPPPLARKRARARSLRSLAKGPLRGKTHPPTRNPGYGPAISRTII